MSNNLYMPFHPGDYHADTAHLRTAAEHGAYMLLLMNYWQSGRALPSDDRKLAAIARVTPSEWAEMRDTICEFFQERDGLLYHKRVETELERARAKSQAAREAVNNRKTNPPKNATPSPDNRPMIVRSSNQEQEQEQEQKAAKAASAPSPSNCLLLECRNLVGQEPVLLAQDFHVIEGLVEGGTVTPDDVKAGIRAAMEKPNFRIRHWSQLEGWARGAAKDRLAGKSKAAQGYKSPVTADTRVWLPQGSEGYEAWRTAFPGVVKATLTTKGREQGISMPTEFPPNASAGAAA